MTESVKKCPWCSRELVLKVVGDKAVCAFCGFKIKSLPPRPQVVKEEAKPLMITPVDIPEVREKPKWPLWVAVALGIVIVVLLVKWFY